MSAAALKPTQIFASEQTHVEPPPRWTLAVSSVRLIAADVREPKHAVEVATKTPVDAPPPLLATPSVTNVAQAT